MNIITIPPGLSHHKSLVAVPRRTYEEFLAWQKQLKSHRTFRPTVAEQKALSRGRKNFASGKYATVLRETVDK